MDRIARQLFAFVLSFMLGPSAFADALSSGSLGKDSTNLPALDLKKSDTDSWDGPIGKAYVQVKCVNDRIARISYTYSVPISLSSAILKHGNCHQIVDNYKEYHSHLCLYDPSEHVFYHLSALGVCDRIDYVLESVLQSDPAYNPPTALSPIGRSELELALSTVPKQDVLSVPSEVIYVDDKHKVVEIRCTNTDSQKTLVSSVFRLAVDLPSRGKKKSQASVLLFHPMNVIPGDSTRWIVPVTNRALINRRAIIEYETRRYSDGEEITKWN